MCNHLVLPSCLYLCTPPQLYLFVTLSLKVPTPQNGQTQSKNSSAVADELFWCVWPFVFTYQSPSHSFSFHLHNLPHSFLFLLFYFYFYIRFYFLLYITTDTNSKPIIGLNSNKQLNLIKTILSISNSQKRNFLDEYKDCFGEIGTLPKVHHITTN